MSANLFEKFASETTSLTNEMNMYWATNTPSDGRNSLSTFVKYLQPLLGSPAIVDNVGTNPNSYVSIGAAITASRRYIYVTATNFDTTALSITQSTLIIFASGAGYQCNGISVSTSNTLTVLGNGNRNISSSPNISYTVPANSAFFNGGGKVVSRGMTYVNQSGTNTPLSSCLIDTDGDIVMEVGAGTNTGVNFSVQGSSINNLTLVVQGGTTPNTISVPAGNIQILSRVTTSSASLIISSTGQVNSIYVGTFPGGIPNGTVIVNNAGLLGAITNDNTATPIINNTGTLQNQTITQPSGMGTAVSTVNFSGANAIAIVCTFNVPTFNTGTGTSLFGCAGGSTWSDTGSGTQGIFNTGSLPNTAGGAIPATLNFQILGAITNGTYFVQLNAPAGGTLLSANQKSTSATTNGTYTISIEGTPVTGLTAAAISLGNQQANATGANTFVATDIISVEIDSSVALIDFYLTLNIEYN